MSQRVWKPMVIPALRVRAEATLRFNTCLRVNRWWTTRGGANFGISRLFGFDFRDLPARYVVGHPRQFSKYLQKRSAMAQDNSAAILAAADALKKASEQLASAARIKGNVGSSSAPYYCSEREERLEWYIQALLFMMALQTFVLVYGWIWVHYPIFLTHQIRLYTGFFEKITLGLFQSADIVTGAVKLTESVASHPRNLDAVSAAMIAVFTSEVFMASVRRIMKQILLDKDVQRIVGVSMAGISKEAVKNTFSFNPNEAEEARRALLHAEDAASASVVGDPVAPENPLGNWLRGVQLALDPTKRQERAEEEKQARAKRLEEERRRKGESGEIFSSAAYAKGSESDRENTDEDDEAPDDNDSMEGDLHTSQDYPPVRASADYHQSPSRPFSMGEDSTKRLVRHPPSLPSNYEIESALVVPGCPRFP